MIANLAMINLIPPLDKPVFCFILIGLLIDNITLTILITIYILMARYMKRIGLRNFRTVVFVFLLA